MISICISDMALALFLIALAQPPGINVTTFNFEQNFLSRLPPRKICRFRESDILEVQVDSCVGHISRGRYLVQFLG